MYTRLLPLLLILLSVGTRQAYGQVTFSLNPAGQAGAPGTSLTFNATLANIGIDTVYLNGDSFTGLGPGFLLDDSPFFNNFPFFLNGGDSVTADIFAVAIGSSIAQGDYFGSFTVTGGADPNAQDILATQNFEVTVTPEGPSAALLLTGLGSIGLWVAFRRLRRYESLCSSSS